ncbi:MAG: biopolymer transporter ExbD [Planctomycetota bacterium]
MKVRNREEGMKNELNMTSMIDIVFLLLVFFVMTFKIVEMEGDFSIRMPLANDSTSVVDPTDLPLKLRLRADSTGSLSAMELNEISLGNSQDSFTQLRANVIGLLGTSAPVEEEAGDGPEIEIDTDYNLRYEYVIEAITAVSGYKDGDQVVKLIEKIKFAKPRR